MRLSVRGKLFLPTLFIALSIVSQIVFPQTVFAADKDWRPVTPEELAQKSPKVESDADAEAIFWEVKLDDSSQDLKRISYVRVKIFTERGRERFSKVDIPYMKGLKVRDVAARVIKADGTIVELKKEDIFEREIAKSGGVKIKAKSFAVPNIEPGVIIEYRYREVFEDSSAKGMQLPFQHDIPVQNLSYYYKPYGKQEPDFQNFNMPNVRFVKGRDGFYLASQSNVPAFKEEPQMPPEDQVRPWMLLQGVRLSVVDASPFAISWSIKVPGNMMLYWGAVSMERAGIARFMNKPDKNVTKAAEEIAAGAATPEEKLKKLYEFAQTQIKNTKFGEPASEEQERKKSAEIKEVGDVLKRKSGAPLHVNLLFGAMATALGFDARPAYFADRSSMFFEPEMTNENFIHLDGIGVRVGDEWRYFNPGNTFLPYGTLHWADEDVWTMLVGEKGYAWKKSSITDYDKSVAKRTGKFKLLEDGTLEGSVRIEYTGQLAYIYKMDNYDESPNKREEDVKEDVRRRMSTAQLSDVSVENAAEAEKPFVYAYKVSIPNYAQKTGKRLILQPGFFEYGEEPTFSSGTRKYDVYFPYPWSENDEVEIALPAGWALDSADAPAPVADGQKIGSLQISMNVDKEQTMLTYRRKFHFGGGSNLLFPKGSYQVLKNMFDMFHQADSHAITLKQK